MFGKLNQNWNSVPAGTEVIILETNYAFGNKVYYCQRADGKKLPGAWGYTDAARIVSNFVDILN